MTLAFRLAIVIEGTAGSIYPPHKLIGNGIARLYGRHSISNVNRAAGISEPPLC